MQISTSANQLIFYIPGYFADWLGTVFLSLQTAAVGLQLLDFCSFAIWKFCSAKKKIKLFCWKKIYMYVSVSIFHKDCTRKGYQRKRLVTQSRWIIRDLNHTLTHHFNALMLAWMGLATDLGTFQSFDVSIRQSCSVLDCTLGIKYIPSCDYFPIQLFGLCCYSIEILLQICP